MQNLVWEHSRVEELRENVERCIVDYLESFTDWSGHDAYHIAIRVGRTVEREVINTLATEHDTEAAQ